MQTTLTDFAVLKPEIYTPLAQTKLKMFIDFMLHGMADRVSIGAGETMPIPGFKRLAGTPDIIGDNYDPQVNKIDPLKDIGVVRHMGKAFGADDLVQIVTGQNPNDEIARQLANYFAEYCIQNSFLSVLKGVFSAAGPLYTSNRYSVYADVADGQPTYATMTPSVASKGLAKLGDNMAKIRAWVMHSKVVGDLNAAGYISTATLAAPYGFDGNGIVSMFLGKPIIMSDTTTVIAGNTSDLYRSYAVVPGAMALGIQKDLNPEQDRDKLKKLNFVSTDIHFAAHIRGCKYVGAIGDKHPTDAELEAGASWSLSAELAKDVGVIAIDTN